MDKLQVVERALANANAELNDVKDPSAKAALNDLRIAIEALAEELAAQRGA